MTHARPTQKCNILFRYVNWLIYLISRVSKTRDNVRKYRFKENVQEFSRKWANKNLVGRKFYFAICFKMILYFLHTLAYSKYFNPMTFTNPWASFEKIMIELIKGGLYGVIPVRIFECWPFPRESPSGGKYTDFPNLIKFGQNDFYVNFYRDV